MKVSPDTTSIFQGVTPAQPRVAFVVAILVGHGLMIYLLLDRSGILRRETPDAELWSRVFISSIPTRAAQADSHKLTSATSAKQKPEIDNVPVDTAPLAQEVATPAQIELPSSSSAPSIDWTHEATVAARRSVEQGSKGRDFGDSTRDDSVLRKKIQEAPHVNHGRRAGVIEMVGPGVERRWVSERCYWEFGSPPPLFSGPGPTLNPLHCMIGPSDPNSHLFDEIKPRYLQDKD
jgi:hypothetical protein